MYKIGPIFMFGLNGTMVGCAGCVEDGNGFVRLWIKGKRGGIRAVINLDPRIAQFLADDLSAASKGANTDS
jgi:hypothetical protein